MKTTDETLAKIDEAIENGKKATNMGQYTAHYLHAIALCLREIVAREWEAPK